uniref:Uncharacterized protein n=1 Tax=Rhizophora mucronata TaxID=61149 RepID=A0A2P2PYI2_RHIMU
MKHRIKYPGFCFQSKQPKDNKSSNISIQVKFPS